MFMFIIRIMRYNKIIHNEKQLMLTSITCLFKVPFSRPFALFSSFKLMTVFLAAMIFDILNQNHLIDNKSQYLKYFMWLIKSRQIFCRKYQGAV